MLCHNLFTFNSKSGSKYILSPFSNPSNDTEIYKKITYSKLTFYNRIHKNFALKCTVGIQTLILQINAILE